ncbi:MAG: eukaryotic-like serine/threonine-protein kinase [Verrucomicrobiota bacterium]|jgi:serine/threonine protein kinase/Flp pilus assembly protein TadD
MSPSANADPVTTPNAERWQRLKSILAEALEKESPEARSATVEHLCADDAALLREAESLLSEAEVLLHDGSDLIEECADKAEGSLPREDVPAAGRRIGSYVVIREIGHGGMGTVYLAARADGYFEKQVAIKVLNRGSGSEEVLRRFRAEREVLARLDHPNIARLIDAGTADDGLPYFIMEFVDGTPVTRFVETHAEPLSRRLDLFLKICGAVETAHRNSIVHRDLKPSNILVNGEGEPKLLDFGIAKLVGREANPLEITACGRECMTPISASPEQVQGTAITTSSDIYALGVVLYEMVTGAKPHRFATDTPSREELRQVVCEQPPIPPSEVVRDRRRQLELRGDLDAILLKALQKNPADRYESVGQFAEDIRRHLTGGPVRARQDNAAYRIRTLVRQRRIQFVLAAAVIVLSLVTAFLVSPRLRSSLHLGSQGPAPFSTNPQTASAPAKSIAVLPFDVLNNDKENVYFADGVQETILTDLANVAALKVISRGSVASYRSRPKNEREIGQALGVAYVLEGSVQKAGERVRVNAQLIDARTMTQVWAQRYDRNLGDLFAVQSELAQAIVSQLKGKLSPDEKAAIETRPTDDMLAYDLFLRARESFYQNNTENAVHLLEQAIARDPRFALAYCLLAEVQLFTYRYVESDSKTLNQAREATETASRLAPNSLPSHLVRAQYRYYGLRDNEGTLRELRSAPLSADNPRFLDLAAISERRLGHWKDALRDGEKAAELDPQNPFVINALVNTYTCLRRFSDAEELASKTIKAMVSQNGYLWTLKSEALLGMGRTAEALATLENSPPDMSRLAEFVRATLFARDFARADQLLANATTTQKEGDVVPFLEGVVARAKGDTAKARSSFQLARDRLEPKLREHPDKPELLSGLSLAEAALGLKESALRNVNRAIELCPTSRDAVDGPMYRMARAQVNAWIGQHDAALAELAEIVRMPQGPHAGELRFDPAWDDIRGYPQFQTILSQADLPPLFD